MTILSLRFENGEIRLFLRHTPAARAILQTLPFSATVQTWGQTLMFDCPLTSPLQNAESSSVIEPGDVAFWADGSSIILGYGPTPLSHNHEIRLAHPVTVWADALDDIRQLAGVSAGSQVTVDLAPAELKTASGQ